MLIIFFFNFYYTFILTFIGLAVYLHKFMSFESEEAGYPKTYLYTDFEGERFDWIKILSDDSKLVPCQLCCLVELYGPYTGSTFLVVGIECEFCNFEYTELHTTPVFPVLRYKKRRATRGHKSGSLGLIVDLVDIVVEPSMVVPTTCLKKDYYLVDKQARDDVRFICPPVEFLLRDHWQDMIHLPEVARTVHNDPTVSDYISGSSEQRTQMYEDLVGTLSSNGRGTIVEDEEEEESDDENYDLSDGEEKDQSDNDDSDLDSDTSEVVTKRRRR